MNEGLYMWAILPPAPITKAIDQIRHQFAETHFCREALKPPVHLTLFDPFKIPEYFEKWLLAMEDWLTQQVTFELRLHNFNFFDNPHHPVVYVDVVKNEQLKILRAGLCKMLRKQLPILPKPGTFNPHFTIGYRDIPKGVFPDIMKEYARKRFDGAFEVNSIYLLKYNYGGWQVYREFKLGIHPGVLMSSLQGNLFA